MHVASSFTHSLAHSSLCSPPVNYLHEGAPKVWYCVPPNQSDLFEEAMRDLLPELFGREPDLLLKLVTHANPRELRARGVEVHRVVHTPGTFIVTMPNVYHSGLNTGFNVAESCNFGGAAVAGVLKVGDAAVCPPETSEHQSRRSHGEDHRALQRAGHGACGKA